MEGQLVSSERSDQLSGKTRRIPTYEQVRWSHHTMTRFSQLEVIKSWILWGNPTFNHKANRPSVPAVSSQTTRRWFVQFHLIQRSILKLRTSPSSSVVGAAIAQVYTILQDMASTSTKTSITKLFYNNTYLFVKCTFVCLFVFTDICFYCFHCPSKHCVFISFCRTEIV